MIARSLLGLMLAFLAPSTARSMPPPQEERFVELESGTLKLRYTSELSKDDGENLLKNFTVVRQAFEMGLGTSLPFAPEISIRLREHTSRHYFTDGVSKIEFQYPGLGAIRPVQQLDLRVYPLALRAYCQIFLLNCVSSSAGLESRLVPSLAEYLRYLIQLNSPGLTPTPLGPLGQVWAQVDDLYGPGTTGFLFNTLVANKVPAHLLGQRLREMLVSTSEDPKAGQILNALFPEIPIYAVQDCIPSDPLSAESPLRMSRVALFNGSRILDAIGEPINEDLRLRRFDDFMRMSVLTYPDPACAASPPKLNGVDLWDLYFEFRARVLKCRDDVDYYLTLREFFSRLQDPAIQLLSMHGAALWFGVTGLSLESVGERIFVSKVTESSEAAAAGVMPGMELVQIDGRPTELTWNTMKAFLLLNASPVSELDAKNRAVNLLLTGNEGSEASLRFLIPEKGKDSAGLEVKLVRKKPRPSPPSTKLVEVEDRADGFAVIKFQSFRDSHGVYSQLQSELKKLRERPAKGLVIDLRGHQGGDPAAALGALSLLLKEKVEIGRLAYRDETKTDGKLLSTPVQVQPSPDAWTGPAVLLVDTWTLGVSEILAQGFQKSKRGPVIGSQTTGTVNQPAAKPYVDPQIGMGVSFTSHAFLIDSGPMLTTGVRPDLLREITAEELRSGVDGVLELAISKLRN